jgi:ATP-dependent helicase Lhr and Lhr-like helicase
VTSFELLHPALQHHIVNSLGWKELRPFQEEVIPRVLSHEHLLVLAPTAGGKTEAAFFPVLSQMLRHNWTGLSLLYICPIKALLNNLYQRIERYCSLLGRRSALWHGDVSASARKRILSDPPDCLLTTPESLEVMLVSRKGDPRRFFNDLQVVIVDEVHAFAGDDRGWHLLAVLNRITKMAGRDIQRIGLSATVGNPENLLNWLAPPGQGTRHVIHPSLASPAEADVKLDFVGSTENAATVLSRLHRGEKRLVFVDSRSRAEQLAALLKQQEVTTFVMHSSLSKQQRSQAEHAFAECENCIIVATSALELGIDVGDLDRVVQVDSPGTVSGILQRMGRSGRRPGSQRNLLFLATSESGLLQAAAIIELWAQGFVEPIEPPAMPVHVLAQQIMALTLQEKGIGRNEWREWVGAVPGFANLGEDQAPSLIHHMLAQDILWEDAGRLCFGRRGEEEFGQKNFMELLTVITSDPLFTVQHGRTELGSVHPISFIVRNSEKPILLLGGRYWAVNHLDWRHKVAHVETSDERGRSRWLGVGQPLSFDLCQAIQHILASDAIMERWSKRAVNQIVQSRQAMPWVNAGRTSVLTQTNKVEWWTFAGARANAALGHRLREVSGWPVLADNLTITIEVSASPSDVAKCIGALFAAPSEGMLSPVSDDAVEDIKFSACLPPPLAREMLARRFTDASAIHHVLSRPINFVA